MFYVFCLFTPLYRRFRLSRVSQRIDLDEIYRLVSKILNFTPCGSVFDRFCVEALKMAENAEKPGFTFFAFLPPYIGVSSFLVYPQGKNFSRSIDWYRKFFISCLLARYRKLEIHRHNENLRKSMNIDFQFSISSQKA